MRTTLTIALALSLAACTASEDETPQAQEEEIAYGADAYSAAIADTARPDADRARDEARKPGELLAFAQIDEGETVGDYIMGGGYVTRLLAKAVGENGKVYAFTPDEFVAFRAEYAAEQDAVVADYENVEPLRAPIAAPAFPEPLDTIVTVMNLHDLYIPQMPEGTSGAAIAALHGALKPGGVLVVIDHSAVEGSDTQATDGTHRIDRQTVIDDLTAAGFVLEAESDLYARPDDTREANVFDPAIQGQTDQFALRFRKAG